MKQLAEPSPQSNLRRANLLEQGNLNEPLIIFYIEVCFSAETQPNLHIFELCACGCKHDRVLNLTWN